MQSSTLLTMTELPLGHIAILGLFFRTSVRSMAVDRGEGRPVAVDEPAGACSRSLEAVRYPQEDSGFRRENLGAAL